MITLREGKRGCGYRKAGGLYLVSPGSGRPCGLLPIPLVTCPTCGHGIKFSRGWTWVNVASLAAMNPSGCEMSEGCGDCPLADAKIQKAGLLWIGEQYYKTPEIWAKEAREMGISRRIKSVPHGFKIGETWVALAHIRAIPEPILQHDSNATPGIFRLFKPTAIQYVVKGDETFGDLDDLEKRGVTPVKIQRDHAVKPLVVKEANES
jgi:hypothetical protein